MNKQVEQIRAEIVRRIVNKENNEYATPILRAELCGLLSFINSLPEEPSKEQMARSAASEWCRCWKCDGIINDTQSQCVKPNVTCFKWRDAYRAAKIALGKLKVAPGVEVKIADDRELQRHQDELHSFKVFAIKQAREHRISFVYDFEWNNFCEELLSYFNEKQKPAEGKYYSSPDCGTTAGVWSEEDEKHINNILDFFDYWKAAMRFVSYQVGTIDADINWLKSLRPQPKCLPGFDEMTPEEKMNHPLYLEGFDAGRDVGKVETEQPKQEWSEEDERILKGIIGFIDHDQHYGVGNKEMLNWLKSLRPQPKWEPSDEQMNALHGALVPGHGYDYNVLASLYVDLKKLMEE